VSWAPPTPAAAPQARPRLSARTRYILSMEQADTARAELGAAVLEGATVQEVGELYARWARLEAQVVIADRRNGLVTRLAQAAGRVIR
jgi:hypothetical protein